MRGNKPKMRGPVVGVFGGACAILCIVWALCFFRKQFTVGVLNATLDLAALVLVGVVGFLGSEVVLSPVVSGCLPSCGG